VINFRYPQKLGSRTLVNSMQGTMHSQSNLLLPDRVAHRRKGCQVNEGTLHVRRFHLVPSSVIWKSDGEGIIPGIEWPKDSGVVEVTIPGSTTWSAITYPNPLLPGSVEEKVAEAFGALDLYRGIKCVSGFMFKKEKQTSGRGVDKGFRLQKIPSLKPNVLLMKVPDNAFICYLPGSDSLPSSVRHFYGSSHFSATTNSSVSSLQSLDGDQCRNYMEANLERDDYMDTRSQDNENQEYDFTQSEAHDTDEGTECDDEDNSFMDYDVGRSALSRSSRRNISELYDTSLGPSHTIEPISPPSRHQRRSHVLDSIDHSNPIESHLNVLF
jgi:hypothetical protein